MKVDGKLIAESILKNLKREVSSLKKQKVTPHLAIILIGHNHASLSYVNQKKQKAELIGAKTTIYHFEDDVSLEKIEKLVRKLNNDLKVHGIIIQRPLPPHIGEEFARNIVTKEKDVDGFLPNSRFDEPIAEAVLEILKTIFLDVQLKKSQEEGLVCKTVTEWLKSKQIVVVGKGDTGGRPVINLFKKMKIEPVVVDSKTPNPGKIIKSADILISTVGKPVIRSNEVKNGAIVIGIGMHKKEESGKLYPDYDQEEISKIASYYSPVPGGVGPVNVAMLLKNLIFAIDKSRS